MEEIKNKTFPGERALYNQCDATITKCRFEGEEDGESALKEARNIEVSECYFDLRYPLWHVDDASIEKVEMSLNCRAPLWYASNIVLADSTINGVKAVRECNHVEIDQCKICSPEFGWKNNDFSIEDSEIESEYAFFASNDVRVSNLKLKGKYAFQYVSHLMIEDSVFQTKDAFWHTNNVVIINSTINGEYLGWYSKNMTLINCHITGRQPLCYCQNLKLIDCTMEGCDLAFENSVVKANIIGSMKSIKNVRKGQIIVDSCEEIINEDAPYPVKGKVIVKNK